MELETDKLAQNTPPSLELNLEALHDYQRNRFPYLMMDAANVIPGVSATGHKDLPKDTWFFACHFPRDPNVPGALQLEAIVQVCALTLLCLPGNKNQVAYLSSARNVKFKRK